ncbi:Hypothetical predicted protein [Marmota monax]|uniref:VWFD domain-containing protein n=1 Tax=Marmota monax TaxID=9995 RepID=A0A5E4CKS3_MARMO|nr:Hypothetical predicted protein [Marmota monax]
MATCHRALPSWDRLFTELPSLPAKSCPGNMVYLESGSPCVDTCSHLEVSSLCEEHHMDGCFCPEGCARGAGTVYDDLTGSGCIPVSQCHCKLHGHLYVPGQEITNDCEQCVCHAGRWVCKDLPCPGTCTLEGGSHITTFDGKKFTFHGDCYYVLTKGDHNDSFTLLGELAPCGSTDKQTCLKTVALLIDRKKNVVAFKSDGSVLLNELAVTLPHVAASFSIFQPSSYHIVVNTALGLRLQVQLVPVMQLFVTLDQAAQGQVQGLCGDFNGLESDDFRTAGGLVEATGSSFANSWKAQASCHDKLDWLDDPCSLNIESEDVDRGSPVEVPGPYPHQSSTPSTPQGPADGRDQRTSLPATTGLPRSESLSEAPTSTLDQRGHGVRPGNKRRLFLHPRTGFRVWKDMLDWWTVVWTASERLPLWVTEFPKCGHLPTPTGLVWKNLLFPATHGDRFTRTMVAPEMDLRPLHQNSVLLATTHRPDPSPRTPPRPDGDLETRLTLVTSGETTPQYHTDCVSGCVCPEGLLDDGRGGCVVEEECPCVHNKDLYAPGDNIKLDCNNTCTCQRGRWQCTQFLCHGTCSIYGSGHYITFDGKHYDFDGHCSYVAVQDYCGQNSSTGSFSIITENVPCGTTGVTCSKAIKIFIGRTELKLEDKRREVVQLEEGHQVAYTTREVGQYLVVEASTGIIVIWDKKTTIFIKLAPSYKGTVCGLCGNFDDRTSNDFTTRDHMVVSSELDFGNSWKEASTCPDVSTIPDPCSLNPHRRSWAEKQCSIIKSRVFSVCHSKVGGAAGLGGATARWAGLRAWAGPGEGRGRGPAASTLR